MTAKKKQLLIESCEFVSKIKMPKKLKESVKLSAGKSGTLIVRNIPVTILNRENQNGRIYSTEEVQRSITAAQPLIEAKQLLSQACEHPEGSYVSPTTASHVVIGAYIKPNLTITVGGKRGKYDVLFNDWEVLNTQEGKNLRALFEAECSIGTSIRGLGDLVNGKDVVDYEYLGTDCVGNPSSSTFTRMPVAESVKVELEDREPLSEGFVVSTSSTNVVSDLEKAAVIQANLDNATYGTVVKTHTTLDSEVDPKTGATTEITTLEAETEDEVGTLDQALQMAKNAMLNNTVNVDSVTIENVKDENEVGGKKEAAPEYVPEDGIPMNEEETDPTYLALKKTGYYDYDDPKEYMEYINQNADKLDAMELADANSINNKYLKGEMSKELACHELQNISNAISLRTPFELSDSTKEAVKEATPLWIRPMLGSQVDHLFKDLKKDFATDEQKQRELRKLKKAFENGDIFLADYLKQLRTLQSNTLNYGNKRIESVKEAKEKDPKEGKQFVLKAPNGYVSMEGNALVFKDDPKKALHFIVGKENTGLVHLSEVEKILDTMGVYDVTKYYKRDLGDISAPAEGQPQKEGLFMGDINANLNIGADNTINSTNVDENALDGTPVNPIEGQPQVNASLKEENPSNTRYVATVQTEGQGDVTNAETVPVSAVEGEAILSEVGNLWKQKSKNGSENLVVVVKDTMNGAQYTYNPSSNTLDPVNGGAQITAEQPEQQALEADPQLTIKDPAVMEANDDIEQDDNKLTMKIDPENPDSPEVEKEFDTKAQADVAKAGMEKGEIDGSIMLNEDDDSEPHYDDLEPGWYAGVKDVGVIGPYKTEEEAREGLEAYGDTVSVEYIGPTNENVELEEDRGGALLGGGLGGLVGGLPGAAIGGALGSMAQDYFSNKQRKPGWKSGAILGGALGSALGPMGTAAGAAAGAGLQNILTGDKGTFGNMGKATKNVAQKVGSGIKAGYNAFKKGYQADQAKRQADAQAQDQQQNAQASQQTQQNTQAQQTQQAAQNQQANTQTQQQNAQAQQQAAEQQAQAAAQQQAEQQQAAAQQSANLSAQVLQQVQATQVQVEQALNQLQLLQATLQGSPIQQQQAQAQKPKVVRGKDGRFMRAESVDEQSLKDAVENPIIKQQEIDMYNNPDPYKQDDGTYWEPGLELVKKEIDKYPNLSPEAKAAIAKLNENSLNNITVTLSDIDWDIDSIIAKASNADSDFDASDLDMTPEQYAIQADDTDLGKEEDLLSLIQNLPNELTISLKDVAISENPVEIKQAILNAANEQTPYQINNATITAVQ